MPAVAGFLHRCSAPVLLSRLLHPGDSERERESGPNYVAKKQFRRMRGGPSSFIVQEKGPSHKEFQGGVSTSGMLRAVLYVYVFFFALDLCALKIFRKGGFFHGMTHEIRNLAKTYFGFVILPSWPKLLQNNSLKQLFLKYFCDLFLAK